RGWEREAPIANCQPDVVRGNGEIEQPRWPELPACPAAERGANPTPDILLSELAEESNRDHECRGSEHDRPTTELPSREPSQQLRANGVRQREDADCPHGNRRSGHREKSCERQTQESRCKISRQPSARN